MPKKGDDLDSAMANAVADNLSNVTAEYTPAAYPMGTNKTIEVKGVFSRPYIESNEMSGYAPVFSCLASLIANSKQGDKLKIASVNYQVIEPRPDGLGWLQMILQKI